VSLSQLSISQMIRDKIDELAVSLERQSAEQVVQWAVGTFEKSLTFACSFGAEDIVILDVLMKTDPQAVVFYLDTGLHFPETYQTRDRLAEKYGVEFIQVRPSLTLDEQEECYGPELWKKNPDLCCKLRKVDPLVQTLQHYLAWMTGIRREQSVTRAKAKKVEWDQKFKLIKINPLADWSVKQVWAYIHQHQLPYNPLHDRDYPSIGCQVCTKPVRDGADPRSGRWDGYSKSECGLHK
jgi:phosphoadenosine phosphosulfate reductase